MGLTETESLGLRMILCKMDVQDVLSLASTITLRMVAVENMSEAINAIICYADSVSDVLRRKKLKKEYIFKYLHDVGAAVLPHLDKRAHIKALLAYWGSSSSSSEVIAVEAEDDMQVEELEVEESEETNNRQMESVYQRDVNVSNFTEEIQVMARVFSRWFYTILNGQSVIDLSETSIVDNYGPHHFWQDCRLRIRTPANEQVVEGSQLSSETLKSFLTNYGLILNPFDTEAGVKGWSDPHGLVTVLVGGAVHKNDRCLGVFEQVFGLIRDPTADNNWKIKFSEIRLSSKEEVGVTMPSNVALE